MQISEIAKREWEIDTDWQEKWYSCELCFEIFIQGHNPLDRFFSGVGLNVLTLNSTWYYEKEPINLWLKDRDKAVQKRAIFLKKLVKESQKYISKTKKIISKISKLQKINKDNLTEIKKGFIYLWYVFLSDIGNYLDKQVTESLDKKGLDKNQIEDVKNNYFTITKPLAFQQSEHDLADLNNEYKKKYKSKRLRFDKLPKVFKNKIVNYWFKYGWIDYIDIDTEPRTIRDIFERVKYYKQPKTHVKEYKLNPETKKLLNKQDSEWLSLIKKHIYLDNLAADLWGLLELKMADLIYQQLDISFKDLTWYSFSELERLIKTGQKLSDKNLNIRKKYRVMVQIDGDLEIFYGKISYLKIKKRLDSQNKKIKVNQFSGTIASLGKVQGMVKIIKGVKDIKKISKGEILVAPTTRADLMAAIQKCAAIVTDSGGITSHAAIISRELKIPCIIGTDVATQVLKDGDLVEVDASNGLVKILS